MQVNSCFWAYQKVEDPHMCLKLLRDLKLIDDSKINDHKEHWHVFPVYVKQYTQETAIAV